LRAALQGFDAPSIFDPAALSHCRSAEATDDQQSDAIATPCCRRRCSTACVLGGGRSRAEGKIWRGSTSACQCTPARASPPFCGAEGRHQGDQTLLGHKRLDTTALDAQVAIDLLREVTSPLDTLQPAYRATWSAPGWRSRTSSAPTAGHGGKRLCQQPCLLQWNQFAGGGCR
jgi:hypothetical protein